MSHCGVLVVDEAGMVAEAQMACLAAQAPELCAMVIAGDARQILAHIPSGMQRPLVREMGHQSALTRQSMGRARLTSTFRLRKELTPIISDVFYDGEMTYGGGGADDDNPMLIASLRRFYHGAIPLMIVDVASSMDCVTSTGSRTNLVIETMMHKIAAKLIEAGMWYH